MKLKLAFSVSETGNDDGDASPRNRWKKSVASTVKKSRSKDEVSTVVTDMMDVHGHQIHEIHVRGIGKDGWDGTDEGCGTYENEAALKKIFSPFGEFMHATIRHRIDTIDIEGSPQRSNTSWALVAASSQAITQFLVPCCGDLWSFLHADGL